MVKKKKPGRDRTLGASVTSRNGKWDLGKFRNVDGKFYAIARPRSFEDSEGNTIVCRKDRSRTIRV